MQNEVKLYEARGCRFGYLAGVLGAGALDVDAALARELVDGQVQDLGAVGLLQHRVLDAHRPRVAHLAAAAVPKRQRTKIGLG